MIYAKTSPAIRDYVSARAEARANANVGQGHTRSVAFYRLRFVATPWRATAGYHAGNRQRFLKTLNRHKQFAKAQRAKAAGRPET